MSSYTLGLDLGSASIGWAVVEPSRRVVDCGVRIFDPGVDPQKYQRGEEGSSNNLTRRVARLHRRQLRRRAGRQRELFAALQSAGLMPTTTNAGSENRDACLAKLDADLRKRWKQRLQEAGIPEQWLVYLLRRTALDHRLELFEVGRVLYQLAQRRGYKSNRKETPVTRDEGSGEGGKKKKEPKPKAGDDRRKVLDEIAQLEREMASSGARTLGEYFCRLDPGSQRNRPHIIRERFTPRKLYEQEFEAIWQAQMAHHPALTEGLRDEVRRLLFYQRPIAPGKPGFCELEPGELRAPRACLAAQRFRVLQKVNDLRIMDTPDGTGLTPEQRTLVADALEANKQLTFEQIRRLLKLPANTGFNLQRGDEKKLVGNRTNAALQQALGETWSNMDPQRRETLIDEWLAPQQDEALLATLRDGFALSEEQAQAVVNVHLEEGYSPLSRRSLGKLLPLMEEGISFKTAEARIYDSGGTEPLPSLPPVDNVIQYLPNPAVKRALTELRKVVNAIIAKHGIPAEVRIELAREIKKTAKERSQAVKSMREGERRNSTAAEILLKELGIRQPRGFDLLKVRLYQECREICVYCGKHLGGVQNLFDGSLDVDHILPRNRFPDDSFANRVLVHKSCNRQKLGRTPWQAFGSDPEHWSAILERVKKLGSTEKMRRFLHGDDADLDLAKEDSFSSRRLNDTRYMSKVAAKYLGTLYGGRDIQMADGSRRRKVYATSGVATATLRRAWGLEAILRQPEPAPTELQSSRKPRTDHRHHAVDAITISLTSNAAIQQLGHALAMGVAAGAERISPTTLQAPWPNFVPSIEPMVKGMQVSHRPNHNLRGQLHEETNYSPPKKIVHAGKGKQKAKVKEVVHVRKPVHLLSEKQIRECIVDKRVREAVVAQLEAVGGKPENLEKQPAMLKTRKGDTVPIFRARIRMPGVPLRVARGARERYVASAGNHHLPIFEVRENGKIRWDGPGVVSRHEAHERLREGAKVVQKEWMPEAEFLFYLMGGDLVRMDHPSHAPGSLFVVRTISEGADGNFEIDFVRDTDARLIGDIKKDDKEKGNEGWVRARNIDSLRAWNCRKVFVNVLGKSKG